MNSLTFIFCLLCLISVDFVIYNLYKYFNLKYFSRLEINQLKEENKYLKEQNQKLSGSTSFWSKNDNLR